MCLALYLFTDARIEEVGYDEARPAFWVRRILESDQPVKKWVSDKADIYYMGSSTGCGCGWAPLYESDEKSEIADKARDRERLCQLLESGDFTGSHLIACWEGDQGRELERQETLHIADIRDPHFVFEECVDYLIEGDP